MGATGACRHVAAAVHSQRESFGSDCSCSDDDAAQRQMACQQPTTVVAQVRALATSSSFASILIWHAAEDSPLSRG